MVVDDGAGRDGNGLHDVQVGEGHEDGDMAGGEHGDDFGDYGEGEYEDIGPGGDGMYADGEEFEEMGEEGMEVTEFRKLIFDHMTYRRF